MTRAVVHDITKARMDEFMESMFALSTILEDYPEARKVLVGYAGYLLGEKPRSYVALAEFLELYGKTYLFHDIISLLQGKSWEEIYELGPGTGWLINSLGSWGRKRIAIDKRTTLYRKTEGVTFAVQDLENDPVFLSREESEEFALDKIVIANQFLHCADNWEDIIQKNRAWWLVIEVKNPVWMMQMARFGATPLTPGEIRSAFEKNRYILVDKLPLPNQVSFLTTTLWRPY